MTLQSSTVRALAACAVLCAGAAPAQISLQSAVNLALKNSPRVRSAQADLDKARAARGEAKDAYIPVVSTQAGYGLSTGAPLGVPVVFSISSQSLIFSFSQRDYIRSTEASVQAAEYLLQQVETEVIEDTTNAYLALDNAVERKRVLAQELGFADRLVRITSERIDLGVDAKVELPKSRRTATQIRLSSLLVDDEVAQQRAHLATLTGLPPAGLVTDPASIPAMQPTTPADNATSSDTFADSQGIKAAFAAAKAKAYAAFGDRRYLFRPQVTLVTNYSRVATSLSSYADYYPRYAGTPGHPNSENSLGFGLQFSIPLLDYAHRSKARESAADARKAEADAVQQRGVYREGRAKLQNAVAELDLRAQLARDEQEIAEDQLEALRLQLQANAANVGSTAANPKDELSAQLQERQRYADLLSAQLQLRQTQVNLMRQTEGLGQWVLTAPGSRSTPPALPGTAAGANVIGTPGSSPIGTPQGGVAPTPVPSAPTPATPPSR